MPKIIFIFAMLVMLQTATAWGATCLTCNADTETGGMSVGNPNCPVNQQTKVCKKYDGMVFYAVSCTGCADGESLKSVTTSVGDGCSLTYYTCVVPEPTCYTSNGPITDERGTGCVEYTKGSTTAVRCDSCNDGYNESESPLEMCDSSTSKTYSCTKRRFDSTICKENQYKNTSGDCTDCPSGGTTDSFGGGSAITDCYLPAGTEFTDTKGSGTYTSDCYYTRGVALPGLE